MATKHTDVIIMSGGRGTRISQVATYYGCKSLIPINGFSAIEYVLRAVRVATSRRIFLCIERPELLDPISKEVQKLDQEGIEIYLDNSIRGTMHAVYKLRDRIQTNCVMVLYGHHLVRPEHLCAIHTGAELHVVASLYNTSSNNPRSFSDISKDGRLTKISRGDSDVQLREAQYYIDPPYCFPRVFTAWLQDRGIRCHEAIKDWVEAGNAAYGCIADFPHEFHYAEELESLARFSTELKEQLSIQ